MKDNYIDIIPPPSFNPQIEVVGCRIKYNDKMLMLLRSDHKPQGNLWGEPAGKINEAEDKLDAIYREVFEETGIKIDKNETKIVAKFYVRYPEQDFVYYSYKYKLDKKPNIRIDSDSHKAYRWVDEKEVMKLKLIGGMPTRFSKFLHLYK